MSDAIEAAKAAFIAYLSKSSADSEASRVSMSAYWDTAIKHGWNGVTGPWLAVVEAVRATLPRAAMPGVDTLDATLANACEWFDKTIPHTADDDVTKFREESKEFLEQPSVEEAADALLCLWHWAHLSGEDLHGAIRAKMAKNAARKWERQSNGTWHHVKPPAPTEPKCGESDNPVALLIETTCPRCRQQYADHLGDETECVCPPRPVTPGDDPFRIACDRIYEMDPSRFASPQSYVGWVDEVIKHARGQDAAIESTVEHGEPRPATPADGVTPGMSFVENHGEGVFRSDGKIPIQVSDGTFLTPVGDAYPPLRKYDGPTLERGTPTIFKSGPLTVCGGVTVANVPSQEDAIRADEREKCAKYAASCDKSTHPYDVAEGIRALGKSQS